MMIRLLTIAGAGALAPCAVLAHAGHGLPGASHWHASDVFGLVLAVAAVAGLWWLGRGK
jgi:hypothetical protein